MEEVKLYIKDNGNKQFDTVRDLLETLESEKSWHVANGRLEEFLNQKIELQLADIEGQIVCGNVTCVVGTCDKTFIITGNVDSVRFIKE